MKRVIVHSDINHAYAQIEEMKDPSLRLVPMAVGGHEEDRHGIILAKNDLAKAAGVRTGESLREAFAKCPTLRIVHPHYDDYVYYTEKVKDVYRQYTDQVESFGLDEAWIDLTHSQQLFGDGVKLAERIQDEIHERYGLCVSMGVSWNKVYAKLGSDLLKHKGFALIDESNYQELVWSLPVSDLLMVGRQTSHKLERLGIYTIGDLANTPEHFLKKQFGKIGSLLWTYANGYDTSPVQENGHQEPVKSIGNSKTVKKDIRSYEQLDEVLRVLSESCAARLRREGLRGYVVSVWLRGTDLAGKGKQRRLSHPTDIAEVILETARDLARSFALEPVSLRGAGVNISELCFDSGLEQPDLFEDPQKRIKERRLEMTLVKIREKYGYQACRLASLQVDEELTAFDPLSVLHKIHPVGALHGPIGS